MATTEKTTAPKATKAPAAKATATKSAAKTAPKAAAQKTAKSSNRVVKTPSAPRTPKRAALTGSVTVTQTKSGAGRVKSQQATLTGLGLGRIGKTRTLQATPAIQGMIEKVAHLIAVNQTNTKQKNTRTSA